MRNTKLLVLLGVASVLSGCVTGSLQPLYTDKDVVFDPGLVGPWRAAEEGEEPSLWTFVKAGDKAYTLTFEQKTDDGKPDRTLWEAHAVSLGMYTFLDVSPAPVEAERSVVDKYGYLGLHNQYLLWRDKDTFRLASLDADWLEKQVEQAKVHVAIAKLESGDEILTGSPEELRELYQYAASYPKAFTDLVVCKRVK